MCAEDNLIRDFQKETSTFLDPEKQIRKEEREKEWDLEKVKEQISIKYK